MSTFDDMTPVPFDEACRIVEAHADEAAVLMTSPFPGMTLQISGPLLVQRLGEQIIFAVNGGEHLGISVVPFPVYTYQIQTGEGVADALICAMTDGEGGQDVMLWMLQFGD